VTQTADSGAIVAEMEQLLGDVVSVRSRSSQNGLTQRWLVDIVRESPEPLSTDQLQELLRIVWENTQNRPSSVGIKVNTPDGRGVDLHGVADELGVEWHQYGYGVSIRQETVAKLLGEWPGDK